MFYREKDDLDIYEYALKIYGWDIESGQWEEADGCIVDEENNTVSTTDTRFNIYQIMFYSPPPSPSQDENNDNAAPPVEQSRLGQNYPNPFNPATTINYYVDQDCHVAMKLYNIRGQLVAVIVDEYQSSGQHSVYFDGGEKLSRGIYYYQMKAGKYTDTKRMVILR
jgi:hypothetical protein